MNFQGALEGCAIFVPHQTVGSLSHCDIYSPFHLLSPTTHISKAPSGVVNHLPGEPLAQASHSWPTLGCTQCLDERNQGSVGKGPDAGQANSDVIGAIGSGKEPKQVLSKNPYHERGGAGAGGPIQRKWETRQAELGKV